MRKRGLFCKRSSLHFCLCSSIIPYISESLCPQTFLKQNTPQPKDVRHGFILLRCNDTIMGGGVILTFRLNGMCLCCQAKVVATINICLFYFNFFLSLFEFFTFFLLGVQSPNIPCSVVAVLHGKFLKRFCMN